MLSYPLNKVTKYDMCHAMNFLEAHHTRNRKREITNKAVCNKLCQIELLK